MTAWYFFLKLCCNTFCCSVDDKIFSPTSFAVSTFPLIPALIPLAMLRVCHIFHLPCRCQVFVLLTCVVLYTSMLLDCIVYLSANRVRHQSDEALGFGHARTSGQTSTCLHAPHEDLLIVKSRESSTQNRSDLRTTWSPWSKCLDTSGWVS